MFGIALNRKNQTVQQVFIFFQLLRRDVYIFSQNISGKMINTAVWSAVLIFANHYVTPYLGLPPSYGKFMLAGAVVVQLLFQAMNEVALRVSDLVSNREVMYALGLPLPAWMVFLRFAVSVMIQGIVMSISALPVAALVLWKDFSFPYASVPKIALMLGFQGIFFGFFSLWVTSFTKNMPDYENVWMRVINPLWMSGCYIFSWAVAKKALPLLATGLLLNPLTYAMEGMRAAILGQTIFLNYWVCLILLAVLTVFFALRSYHLLKKRLDLI